jgi:hypothetical protein
MINTANSKNNINGQGSGILEEFGESTCSSKNMHIFSECGETSMYP